MKLGGRLLMGALLIIPAWIVWWGYGRPVIGIDDANIMFSYAENIARGCGMTYANNGIPVEGSTSLLWTFVSALSFCLGLDEAGVLVLSVLLLVASVYVWLRVLGRCGEDGLLASFITVLLLSSSFGYVIWMSITCMDIVLWGIFVAWLTSDLVAFGEERSFDAWKTVPLYVLIPWVRPESYLVVPMALALMAVTALLGRGRLRGLVGRSAAFAVSLASLFAGRLMYFGYPFPNTYYAKVSPSLSYNLAEGWKYLLSYLGNWIPLLMTVVIVVLSVIYLANVCRAVGKPAAYRHGLCLGPWALGLTLLPVWTGGDHFSCFRFFQAVYPLGCLFLSIAICRSIRLWREKVGDSLLMLLSVSSALLFLLVFGWEGELFWPDALNPAHRMRREFQIAEVGWRNGETIRSVLSGLEKFPRIGVICAGGIARTYPGEIVDLMGLNDVRIAHNDGLRMGIKNHAAFNADRFDEYDVELLPFSAFHTVDIRGLPWLEDFNRRSMRSISAAVLQGLFERPSFKANWTSVKVQNSANGESCVVLMRNDLRRRVEETENLIVSDYTGSLTSH